MTDIGLELPSLDHALGMAIGFAGEIGALIFRSNSFTKLARLIRNLSRTLFARQVRASEFGRRWRQAGLAL